MNRRVAGLARAAARLGLPGLLLLPGACSAGDRIAGGFTVRVNCAGSVRALDLEEYVGGVVLAEVGPGWPLESLRAMAVCARTFALTRAVENQGRDWHLTDTTRDQVYRDGYRAHQAIVEAVESTRGEVLAWQGMLARVFYHADSGGHTSASGSVWGVDYPYLRGGPDPYSTRADRYVNWSLDLAADELLRKLGVSGRLLDIGVLDRADCNRVVALGLTLEGGRAISFDGRRLREQVLGPEKLRSVMFNVRLRNGRVVFTGSGYGHGVGLSQWGARRMADEGLAYRDILGFYFPGTELMLAAFD